MERLGDHPERGSSAFATVQFVRVLGPVQLVHPDGSAADVPGVSQRRLLGLLALHRGRTLRSEYLADVLDVSPGALRKIVSRLRALVGDDALLTDSVGYRLELDVDADRFADACRPATGAQDPVVALDAALALWHGEALEEFRYESWAKGSAARLTELRNAAVEDRIEALLDASRLAEALVAAEAQIDEHPLTDRPRGLLMRALAAAGRPTDAMRAYQLYRSHLGEEVGTEPGPDLRAIERRIAGGWDGRADTSVSDETSPSRPGKAGNLALPATNWIGSTEALKRVADDLPRQRIVTLTGPGGVGKTRSALEVARFAHDAFGDGTWMFELAPISDPDGVTAAVASEMGITPQPGIATADAIVDWLRGRSLLLIFDNCEHVLAPVAGLVRKIVHGSETVTILATSRAPLGVTGERVVSVRTLDPTDSVELFCERARAVDDRAEFDDDDLLAVDAICEQLDRLPLAIELAAARIRTLAPVDILRRLGDRFRLLHGERRDGPQHQRALRTTVEWSYQLLGPEEQLLFDRTSVFSGSFDLAAVEAVCSGGPIASDDVLDLVSSLIDKSMITVDRQPSGFRYRLLDTLRHFGAERLAERRAEEDIRMRHLRHFIAVAGQANQRWFNREQIAADETYDREWDNLRAAHSFACATRNIDEAERLIDTTIAHSVYRMRSEHGDWCEQILALDGDGCRPGAVAFGWTAWWAMVAGAYDRAVALAVEGIRRRQRDDESGSVMSLGVAAFALWSSGRRDDALPFVADLDDLVGRVDPWLEYNIRRSVLIFTRGADLEHHVGRLATLAESFGSPSLIASVRAYQGLAMTSGTRAPDYGAAAAIFEEGVALARYARADLSESQNLQGLFDAKRRLDAADLAEVCGATLRRLYDLRHWIYLWPVVDGAAWVLARSGNLADAAMVIGHLDAHVAQWRSEPRTSTRQLLVADPRTPARLALGAAMSRDEIVGLAIEAVSSCS